MASTSTGMTRLTDSFPFDSKADGYDSSGYPVYDRAVGATTLQDVFAKFFTNGVFPNPGNALQIGKADVGLAVTIQPGIGIINGAMGGVDGDAITVQLDTASPQGNVAYAIMLRYDNTDSFSDSRSLLINVVRSDAATTPTPPEPDTTSPDVYELRLGYVVVPSGATDLSSATVTNEKGLAVCPYAAPFEEIDVSGIVSDFKVSANEALTNLLSYYQANKAVIDAALDDSAATYLQTQISALQEQLDNFDLSGSVDNVTVEYTTKAGEASAKLRVKDGGISVDQLAPDVEDWVNGISSQLGKGMDAYTWADLNRFSSDDSVTAEDLSYLVGQIKIVEIAGFGNVPFQCIGVRHDDLTGQTGKKAGFTFLSQYGIATRQFSSNTTTSDTEWRTCGLRTYLNGDFFNAIDGACKQFIKQVKKSTRYATDGTQSYSTDDSLFELSTREINGDQAMTEGTEYDYFAGNPSNSVKTSLASTSTPIKWWTRTYSSAGVAFAIWEDGDPATRSVTSDGVYFAPAFCI